jgi:hypothetical protein
LGRKNRKRASQQPGKKPFPQIAPVVMGSTAKAENVRRTLLRGRKFGNSQTKRFFKSFKKAYQTQQCLLSVFWI